MTWLRLTVPIAVLAVAGCATPRVEQLRRDSSTLYVARSAVAGEPGARREPKAGFLDELLGRPVDADAAVQIALLNNPRVISIYSGLGFAQADLYDAARLSNPVLGYVGLAGSGDARRTDWSLSQNFAELLFLRFRKAGAESNAFLAQRRVARELLDLEADVRAAQVRYVGGHTMASMRDRVATSTQVAAIYAGQLYDAGNISKLQLARMQEAADLARTAAVRAHAVETAERNALLTLLGLDSEQSVQLEGDYALPSADPPSAGDLRAWALENRLDLLSARESLRFATIAGTHARRWRLLGDTTLGIVSERDGPYGPVPAETLVGPSVSLAIPIFNRGAGSIARAQATIDVLTADLHSLELAVGNDIATRVAALEAARESVTLHRERLVPVQRTIVEESQKQQNYMLIGTFELLAAKQHQYEGYDAYIGALRDYWLASIELMRATGGRFPDSQAGPGGQRVEPLASIESISGERP